MIGETRSNSIEGKEIRRFGLIAFVFFGCLSLLGLWKEKPLPSYLFGSLSVLGLCFILAPFRLKLVYQAWMKIAHFLGRVVTTTILALTYYMVITPAGLIKRLFSGAPLPLKPDGNASSYWAARTRPAQSKEQFLKRF